MVDVLQVANANASADLGKELQRVGYVRVGGPSDFDSMLRLAQSLREVSLQVSIMRAGRETRTVAFLKCVGWLYKIAQIGDGMCRLVCNAIPIPLIHRIMVTDPYLSKDAVVPLHDLFLTLMADQPFKIAASRGYALALAKVAALYGQGIGVAEHCLFGLSVQFLNRYIYVGGMIHEYGFFTTISSSLLELMRSAGPDLVASPILRHRRYNPLFADLKVVFTLPETPRFFCAVCMADILEVFTLVQYLHPQTRLTDRHVEFESRDWMYAFNLYLGLGSLFDCIVNWYESPDSISPAEEMGHPLPTVLEHMQTVLASLCRWQVSFKESSASTESDAKSFHIVLHRFFATCVREGCRFSHLDATLATLQNNMASPTMREHLTALIDFPLQTIVLESQIKADMWRRNGQVFVLRVCCVCLLHLILLVK